MKKMIVSDFDDTLYYHGFIDPKVVSKISEFRKNGNVFVIATGSSYTAFKRKIENSNIEYDYLIINHGSGMYLEDKLIYDEELDIGALNEIINRYDLSKKEKYTLQKATKGNFFSTSREGLVKPNCKKITKIHLELNKNNYDDEMKYLKEKYKNLFNIYEISNNCEIELISNKTSKLKKIEDIIIKNDIDRNYVYAIGDGNSDFEMIKKYNGYSVYNALPRIKEVAIKTVNDVGELIDEIK